MSSTVVIIYVSYKISDIIYDYGEMVSIFDEIVSIFDEMVSIVLRMLWKCIPSDKKWAKYAVSRWITDFGP